MFGNVHGIKSSTKVLKLQSHNVGLSAHPDWMDKTTRALVATNVKRLRKHAGWSQSDLSLKCGVAQTTISSVERLDDKSPTLDTLAALADAFGVPVWTLLIDADDLEPPRLRAMDHVVQAFARLPAEGQSELSRVAEREARYAKVS